MAELAKFDVPARVLEQQNAFLEKARKNGKIKIGVNEATKAVERGIAKLVVIAKDVEPQEIVMHLPLICREKSVPYTFAESKKSLGEKAGIEIATAAIAVVDEGEAKKELQDLQKKLLEIAK